MWSAYRTAPDAAGRHQLAEVFRTAMPNENRVRLDELFLVNMLAAEP